ncbi:RNA 2',3'-cyclic phosphodiesterase [Streptomyces sp. NPDC056987]|uniref:RNA 2',3'-cyclic phosphodiesterase n=1 Tax=Streptomyces sp. NPDC056987 TaxID=3345988 RepID=UPI003642731C
MRLFAAVLPPAAAAVELADAVRHLRDLPGADGLRWTGQEGRHFTLAFLGDVDEALLPELTVRLERAAYRTEPFRIRIHGGGHFGDRTLWAGAAGGLDELRLLAERAGAAARRAGVPMEEHRPYRAHLTLARGRRGDGVDLRPYVEALGGFEGRPWEVSELVLVRSRLPVSGVAGEQPRYEAVLRCPLGRGGRGGRGHPGGGSVGPAR